MRSVRRLVVFEEGVDRVLETRFYFIFRVFETNGFILSSDENKYDYLNLEIIVLTSVSLFSLISYLQIALGYLQYR